jgi:hypothetical protein
MKKISFWARHHRYAARIIIVSSFLLLTLMGIVAGKILLQNDIQVPLLVIMVVLFFYFFGLAIYPQKALKVAGVKTMAFYYRQKTADFLLAASTLGMIICISNRPDIIAKQSFSLQAAVPSAPLVDSSFKPFKTISAFSASLKDENGKKIKGRERKKLLKEQLMAIKKAEGMSKAAKTALTILSILVAIGLLGLVAALACDLSCSGAEGAAGVVLIGGLALVIFLTILALRGINGRKKKPRKKEAAVTIR